MANDLNQCNFIGRLGNAPEMRYLPDGKAVASLSIAVGKSWTDKNSGQKNERTEWVRVEAFGKLAEIMGQYLQKGSQVFIGGEMKTDKFQDKQTGQDRYSTKIIANNMQMLGGKSDDQGQQQPQQQPQQGGGFQQQPQQQGGFQPQQQQGQPQNQGQPNQGFDDNIPF